MAWKDEYEKYNPSEWEKDDKVVENEEYKKMANRHVFSDIASELERYGKQSGEE